MGFTESLTNATKAITATVTGSDDETGAGTVSSEVARTKAAPAPAKDEVEIVASADDDIATADTKLGKATKLIGEGAKTAWELAGRAQERVNERAKRTSDAETLVLSAADDLIAGRRENSDAARRHQRHVVEGPVEIVKGMHEAVEVARLAEPTATGALAKVIKPIAASGPAHGVLAKVAEPAAVFSLGVAASKIVDDVLDADGLSGDSVKPAVDIAVTTAGLVVKHTPWVKAFGLGYTVGSIIDHYTDASTHIADLAEPAIVQTSQIGFLTDRARENDLSVAYRTRSASWTDRDIVRSRSIVREAGEHGILDEDGDVSRYRLKHLMPDGSDDDAVARVAGGIERAVELQKTAGDRYYR